METIAAQPNGFVQGSGLYDLDTGRFAVAAEPVVGVSHLSAVFGLNELCAELIDLVDMPEFKEAYLDYCRYFNATKAEQAARYGTNFGTLLLFQGHSRLDAYAAVQTGDAKLATRAWDEVLQLRRLQGVVALEDGEAERPGHPRAGQRGQLGLHERHRALRPRRHREPGAPRRQDALVTGSAVPVPAARPAVRGGHTGTLAPWTGATTASAACGPRRATRRRLRASWSGPRTTRAGGRRSARCTRIDEHQRRRPHPLRAAVRPDLSPPARRAATRRPGSWRSP